MNLREKLSPSRTLWLLCFQCHCWWFVMLVAKEGKRLLLFSLRHCFLRPWGFVALFSELSFMYILLNSPKSFRHQGLENEKWLLLLPYFAQNPEPPYVSDFPDLHTSFTGHEPKDKKSYLLIYNNHRGMHDPERTETYKNYFNSHMHFPVSARLEL